MKVIATEERNHLQGIQRFAQALCLRLKIVEGAQLVHLIGTGDEHSNTEAVVSWLKKQNFNAESCNLQQSANALQNELSDLLEIH